MSTAQVETSPKSVKKPASALFNAKGIAELTVEGRTAAGKGEARRLRHASKIPAVAYGKELKSTLLSVSPKEILEILQSDRGQNAVIEMQVKGGDKILVMIRDYTYHPVHRGLEHVDFVQVKLDKVVHVDVPLLYTGKPAGVVTGGVIRQVYRTVPVACLPDRIPLKLEIDITHLEMSEHVATKDLKLTEGVTVRLPPEQTLIAIVAPEKERVEDVVATAVPGAPGAAPVAGAAAAPAAAEAGKDAKAAPAAKAAAAAPAKDAKKK
jgi:large subunit ribosomal protein L25